MAVNPRLPGCVAIRVIFIIRNFIIVSEIAICNGKKLMPHPYGPSLVGCMLRTSDGKKRGTPSSVGRVRGGTPDLLHETFVTYTRRDSDRMGAFVNTILIMGWSGTFL